MKAILTWWRSNFLKAELSLVLLLAILFGIWGERCQGLIALDNILGENRQELYGALAAIFGALLGFVITSVSIVLGYAVNEKLTIVRSSEHYQDLWNTFKASIRALSLATVAALIGLVFDRNNNVIGWVIYLNFFTILLASFRLWRVIWVLENVISIITAE